MIIKALPQEFKNAIPVIEKLENQGFEAFFVGGSVRDTLLGKDIHDVDIATNAYPEEVKKIFNRTIDVGIDHGTVLILFEDEEYEITTFRTESTYQDYRRPDKVTFVRSLEEDLKRRDFTINALAMNRKGEVTDLFNGMEDLDSHTIRAVGKAEERFNEDALRMMRALRFASQLNFEIEKSTLNAIHDHYLLLEKISVERIQIEFIKMMRGIDRKKGLLPFIETKAYTCCPGLKEKEKQLRNILSLPDFPFLSEEQVWLMTVHILEIAQSEVLSFMREWKCSNNLMKSIALANTGLTYRKSEEWDNQWLYNLGLEAVQLVESSLPFLNIPSDLEAASEKYKALPIHSMKDIKITGQEILKITNKKPGPWLGSLLKEIEKEIVSNDMPNSMEAIEQFIKENLS